MRILPSYSKKLNIVPHTAVGVITLEPVLNNWGTKYHETRLETSMIPLKTAHVAVSGASAAPTVVMECSNDGVNWVEVATVTGAGKLVNNEAWSYTRLRCTGYTDGQITGSFHGTA